MRRLREKLFASGNFDQFTGVHDADALRQTCHHTQIVSNEQDRHAALGLQLRQQIENLRLHGDIQGGRWLVGNQQFRLAGQGDGDHHPLLHATRQLERIFIEPPRRISNADLLEQFLAARPGRFAAQREMARQHFGNLLPHRQHRIQAGGWLLENHRDLAAAVGSHRHFRQGQQIRTVITHAAAEHATRRRQQTQDALRRHRLAATGLPQQGKGLSPRNAERHAIDRTQRLAPGLETEAQVINFQQGSGCGLHQAALGSNASRTASANRLAASTRMNMAAKAAASDHHTTGSRPSSMRALLIMVPKLIIDGSTPIPT